MAIMIDQCEECGCDMHDTEMSYIVEAMETFGKILCDECFEVLAEDQQ